MKRCRERFTRATGLDGLPPSLRPLVAGGFVSATGGGLWFTIWALYLTRQVGLSDARAGIALSIAGAVGFLAPAPLGVIADRHGPREVCCVLLAVEAVAAAAFVACRSLPEVVLVACVTAACDQGRTGVRAALVTQLAPADQRTGALATARSCAHAGDAIGAGLGALVIAAGDGTAYRAAILANAATYLVYALALRRVPHVPPTAVAHGARRRSEAARDLPFVALAALCGVLTLCWGVMSAGLPLWIAGRTQAPRALSGVLVLLSSVAIAGLQVTFSRAVSTVDAAARAARRSGLSLAICCTLVALAAAPGMLAAAALLLAAGVAHVVGELWFVAASWGLSVPLMRPDRPAEYQGVFATGEATAIMLAPALMSAVIVPGGPAAWVALGLVFAVTGAAARPAARWALRTRPPNGTTGAVSA